MTWTNERLSATLSSIASEIDWPEGSDLAPRVAVRIATVQRRPRRWLALVATAIAVVLFLLTPSGQEAMAWLLRVSGIRVELSESQVPLQPPTTLVGGTEITLGEAERAVGFDLEAPESLPPPDSVQLLRWGGGQQVAMVWSDSEQLPEVFNTGVGLLLIQFEARLDEQLLLKEAPEATDIEPVEVNGDLGYFLSGAPHTVYFENPDGMIANDTIRLSANVLIWMSNGVTYRMESTLDLEESIEIAETLR